MSDLERGSRIADAIERIRAHGGIGFDAKDVAAALDAQRSIKEMENSFNRIKLTLVSELAPVVKQVADWIANVTSSQMPERVGFWRAWPGALVDGLDLAIKDTSNLPTLAMNSKQFEQVYYY